MKKGYLIIVCCVTYIVISIITYHAVDKSIKEKNDRLRQEAITSLNSFFERKPMYVDLLYGPYGCDYKEVQIPAPEEPTYDDIQDYIKMNNSKLTYDEVKDRVRQNLRNVWERRYGNYSKLYELDIFPTEDENIHVPRTGWALKIICKQRAFTTREGIETYLVFPKQIAYKKVSPLLYGSIPSVETAIQEALDFTTKDSKSDLQLYYERGSTYNLISKMESAINNEYYHLVEDPEGTISYGCLGDFWNKPSSIAYGGMHNGYYEVIYHRTQPKSYSIKFIGDTQSDKYRLTAIYIGLLTLIMFGVFVFIKNKK